MPVNVTQSQLTLTSTAETEKFRNPPWWNRRSRLERTLCGVTAVSLVMFLAMAVALAVVGFQYQRNVDDRVTVRLPSKADRLVEERQESNEKREICEKRGCVIAAANLLQNIDESINPCEDFYQFSCGGWIERQVIPDDKSALSVFSLLQDELDKKLREDVSTKMDGMNETNWTRNLEVRIAIHLVNRRCFHKDGWMNG
ncbi:membrane metallo-endopeptidase-like 1 [Limulus polyphemus]|uniref:Membrane metallo-endopeptidase-like 1 n=1 Tax=Limulus polyphemus TaxID=6850 RepID=A0ABM1T714_LIMPO|nr:membrane metallo-endopeptidase-like 1 [Limulus polyphemus]